jgi:hypothetical protein
MKGTPNYIVFTKPKLIQIKQSKINIKLWKIDINERVLYFLKQIITSFILIGNDVKVFYIRHKFLKIIFTWNQSIIWEKIKSETLRYNDSNRKLWIHAMSPLCSEASIFSFEMICVQKSNIKTNNSKKFWVQMKCQ